MKRTFIAALAASALALATPGVAAAHGRHHHGHHARTHERHASGARVLRFGAARLSAAPTTTSPTSEEPVGKVVSFEGGVLTIMLTDKSTVSGKVTEDTELRCQPATPLEEQGDDQGGGGDEGDSQDRENGDSQGQFATQHGDSLARAADAQEGDNQERCTATTALVPGAVVLGAELKLTGAGAVWDEVEVIH
jgi:hypothetical protein